MELYITGTVRFISAFLFGLMIGNVDLPTLLNFTCPLDGCKWQKTAMNIVKALVALMIGKFFANPVVAFMGLVVGTVLTEYMPRVVQKIIGLFIGALLFAAFIK